MRDHDPKSSEALALLYQTEGSWLTRFFRARLRSVEDASDLVQETMLRFLRAQQSSTIDAPQHYLRRTAANLLVDHEMRGSTRIARNSVEMIVDIHSPITIDPHQDLESREELDYWDKVLSMLKPRTREIFLLSRVEGYSYKEIAAEYGMTIWGVKKHMTKAIAHIDMYRREP
jgi:RNA polymerase sigma-70 factor (ECF subfamily)